MNRKKSWVAPPDEDQKVIIMGDSPMAENVANQMAAVRIPGICMGNSLTNLATAVKVVFTDY